MSNYIEDQNNEIEALESIYYDDFFLIKKEPFANFYIKVSTDDYEDNEVRLTAKIEFEFTKNYPDEIPKINIIEYEDDFTEDHKVTLEKLLVEEAEKSKKMVMIFTLISFANDWMINKVESIKEEIRLENEKKLREFEKIEQKKFEGTRVTLESFMEWKKKYEEETGKAAEKLKLDQNKKLTGRQMFETDDMLAKSDLELLKDGEAVCIDESLFEDLDQLDLDDEESDFDPDDITDDSD